MDALTFLSQHVDPEKILNHYQFKSIRNNGRMIRACCKIHNGDNPSAFVFNTDNSLWYCHTGDCGGGDVYNLVQLIEECDFVTAVHKVAEILGVDIANLRIAERNSTHITEMQNWIQFMRKRTQKREVQPFVMECELKQVIQFRSFLPDTLRHFNLQFTPEFQCFKADGSPYSLYNRLVIPIHNEYGVQIGASLRATKSTDYPKWSHQPANIKTSDMLYNYDMVCGKTEIVVCEGIFDVWSFHEIGVPAVCTYGAHMSKSQYELLIKSGADIVLAYDGDDAGRKAISSALKILKYKANVSVIEFDSGTDPENISREDLHERYRNRRRR